MHHMPQDKRVIIFDTTLRDGQQCPGAGMTFEQNLQYADLARLCGIDVLEAGFPAASALDYSIVEEIAIRAAAYESGPVIAALCQLRSEQIDTTIRSLEAVVDMRRGRLHTYVPVDPNLMTASLGSSFCKAKIVEDVFTFCKRAVEAGLEVEFSPEGYSRLGDNFGFCTDLFRAAVEAGATVLNCPDTIGGASRYQGANYFVEWMKKHAAIIGAEYPDKNIIWSVHCHNDLGLAVDNSMAAVFDGPARQIEGCINGVGERAGNAALEQCIMVIKEIGKNDGYYTGIATRNLQKISDFVARHMLVRQPHSPVCGDNAARHSSGGHTNAILKDPLAYQPFDPEQTGKKISFMFGPLSGGNHARSIIIDNGFSCGHEEKAEIAQFIKEQYQDRRKGITDAELIEAYVYYRSPIKIVNIDYSRWNDISVIQFEGTFFDEKGERVWQNVGKDSALRALKAAIDQKFPGFDIHTYASESVGAGINAISRSTISISIAGSFYTGTAEDQDISKSAMMALIKAVNRAYVSVNFAAGDKEQHEAA